MLAAVLALPAFIPLLSSAIVAQQRGQIATGFVQTDQPSYVATAREHFDEGFHLLYGNPYAGYDTPRIYFQPHLFLIGAVLQTGLDPGLVWVGFSIAGTLLCAFVGVTFYREIVGLGSPARKLGLICFFWGGGVLTLTGLAYAIVVGKISIPNILHFDPGPARGWWMLQFGRNLVYGPTEAYFHAVFLLCMLCLIKRRFWLSLLLALLLSISHSFTGLESSLIVAAYLVLGRLRGERWASLRLIVAGVGLVLLHLWYYLIFLNQFPDHHQLQRQMELQGLARSWFYPPSTFLPALLIVGVLSAARLWRWPGLRAILENPRDRLFLLWFLVVFGLTQHYHFIRPIQPIHFAHGYDWIALFFLGAPALVSVLDRALTLEPGALRRASVACLVVFFLADNLFWFATFLRPAYSQAIYLTAAQKDVLHWLGHEASPPEMVVTADLRLGYLVSTYSRVRSWAGFGGSTLDYPQKVQDVEGAFRQGLFLPAWNAIHVLYVQRLPEDAAWKPPAGSRDVYRNAGYAVWDCPPRTP